MGSKPKWSPENTAHLQKRWKENASTLLIAEELTAIAVQNKASYRFQRPSIIEKLISLGLYDVARVNAEDVPAPPPSRAPQGYGKPVGRVPLAGKPASLIKPQEPRRVGQGAAGIRFHSSVRTAGSSR